MGSKKFVMLWILLVTIGTMFSVSSSKDLVDFCYWFDISCDEESTLYLSDLDYSSEFEDYNFTEDGIFRFINGSEEIFESLEKVINKNREKYGEVIETISKGSSFDEVYHLNIRVFNYTLEIDHFSPTGEYIQNMGEIISNDYRGDCDDYALFLYLIAKERRLEVRYVIGWGDGGHAWIRIKVEGVWKDYDSTSDTICDNCIGERYPFSDYFEEEENE